MKGGLGLVVVGALLAVTPLASWAQNPHFDSCNAAAVAGALVVTGQVAGLGNQMRPPTPLHLEATVTAVCLDEAIIQGSATTAAERTYPPKNGNREFALVLNGPVVLPCEPPFTLALSIRVCATTHAICCNPLQPPASEPEPE